MAKFTEVSLYQNPCVFSFVCIFFLPSLSDANDLENPFKKWERQAINACNRATVYIE